MIIDHHLYANFAVKIEAYASSATLPLYEFCGG